VSGTGSFITDLRIVLRGRDFRRLFVTRLSSQTGDGAFQVALASLIFFSPERAATAREAALLLTVAVLPYTVIGPVAGVLLDLWPRRQVLVVVNAVRAVMVLGVAALVASGQTGPALYVLVLACMSVNRFFLAGLGASLPHVVPADELVMANAVSPTCGTMALMVGGGLALLGRRQLGAGDRTDALLLMMAAGWYLGSALLARRMAPDLLGPDRHPEDPAGLAAGLATGVATRLVTDLAAAGQAVGRAARGLLHDVGAGARHVRDRRPAAHALVAIGAHRFAFGISTIATLLLCRNYLRPNDVDAGLALLTAVAAVTGAGIAVAAVLTPPVTRRIGAGRWIVLCFALAAVTESIFVWVLTEPLLYAGAFAIGLAAQGSKICVDSIVQTCVDDEFRGRAFSFYDVVFNAAFVAAAAFAATVVPSEGFSPGVYAIITGIYACTAIGYARAQRGTPAPAMSYARP
jgi:MFS family permease